MEVNKEETGMEQSVGMGDGERRELAECPFSCGVETETRPECPTRKEPCDVGPIMRRRADAASAKTGDAQRPSGRCLRRAMSKGLQGDAQDGVVTHLQQAPVWQYLAI